MKRRGLMQGVILTMALSGVSASPSFAEKRPEPGPADSRLRTVLYNPRDVVKIVAHYGFQTLVQFADGEAIENISIGDSLAWQVSPNERGNLLFLKPIERDAQTNLTIVTQLDDAEQRVYVFALDARSTLRADDPALTWTVKFRYPEVPESLITRSIRRPVNEHPVDGDEQGIDPAGWNFHYSYDGDAGQVPLRIFDNGRFTYFEFDAMTDTPAIFLVDADANESVVNSVRRGRYFVVQRTGREFALRNGDLVTSIYNEAFTNVPALDQASPIERQ